MPKSKSASRKSKCLWRRGWDSNPRNGSPFTALPGLPIQPLLHLSPGRTSDCEFRISDSSLGLLNSAIRDSHSEILVAERVGFEPTVGVNPLRFSRPVH